MTLLRNTSLALILSTSLVMGACSNKDKGPSAEKSAPGAALGLKAPSDKAFAKHFDVPSRKTSDAEGKQALAALNLLEKSDDALSWAKTSGKNGNYSFKNLTAEDPDGEGQITITNTELRGVHMEGDVATFDRADFTGIKIYNETDDVTVTMATLSVARPTPDMAKAIITSLQNIKELDDLDLDTDDGDLDMGFGALGMGGIKIASPELNLTTDSLMWGQEEGTKLTDFKIEDVDINIAQPNQDVITATLKSFSATGLRGDMFDNLPKSGQSPLGMMDGFNPLAKLYNTLKMEDLNIDSKVISVVSKGFEGKSTEKRGVTTQRSVGEPLIIKFKEAPEDRDMKRAYDMIQELGFDELVFESSQTTVIDSNTDTIAIQDGLFSMKDGFNLSYNYGASGVKAMTDMLQELDSKGANSSQGQAGIQAAMETMKLNGFQMRLEDKSIVERGLKIASQLRGSTPDKVKKEAKVMLSLAPMMASGLEGDILGELSGALGQFIESGGTLSIVVDPKTPLSVNQLADYKASKLTMEDIGFSAKAE